MTKWNPNVYIFSDSQKTCEGSDYRIRSTAKDWNLLSCLSIFSFIQRASEDLFVACVNNRVTEEAEYSRGLELPPLFVTSCLFVSVSQTYD